MRKSASSVIMVVMVAVAIESMAQVTYLVIFGSPYNRSQVAEGVGRTETAVGGQGESQATPKYLSDPLHPYLGYVRSNDGRAPSAHGFNNYFPPDALVPADTVSILLTGGSTARGLTRGKALTQRFNAYLEKEGIPLRVRIFKAALGGYKQPQQLLAVSYFLSLGAHFDIVINMDGFNEIVLPYSDNARWGVNPFFPRSWANRLQLRSNKLDPVKVGELAYLRERQSALIRIADQSPVAVSALFGLVMKLLVQELDRDIVRISQEIVARSESVGFEEKGPDIDAYDQGSVHRISADLWARGSLVMAGQLRGLGIEYYHFLQPNQYVEGSKPLSDEEREKFYTPDHPYGQNAIKGYPLLVEKGQEISRAGVHYFDATNIFSSEQNTVYMDSCCHLNLHGNRLLVDFVVERVMGRSKVLSVQRPKQ